MGAEPKAPTGVLLPPGSFPPFGGGGVWADRLMVIPIAIRRVMVNNVTDKSLKNDFHLKTEKRSH